MSNNFFPSQMPQVYISYVHPLNILGAQIYNYFYLLNKPFRNFYSIKIYFYSVMPMIAAFYENKNFILSKNTSD
jgi:hypothetical protein